MNPSRSRPRHGSRFTGALLAIPVLAIPVLAIPALATPVLAIPAQATSVDRTPAPTANKTVVFHGVRLPVPGRWRVVDLRADPHACVRFDRPTVYLGAVGDQAECPAHLLGGAPWIHLVSVDGRVSVSRPSDHAGVVEKILSRATVGESATRVTLPATPRRRWHPQELPLPVLPLPAQPGTVRDKGFDTCAAPSQLTMNAWLKSSPYATAAIYFGGPNQGCDQHYLSAGWVTHQVRAGWHLVSTFVGSQAPCAPFHTRMSWDPETAMRQGASEATTAAHRAGLLGIPKGSVLYDDMEAYDNSHSNCVLPVLSYLSGWAETLRDKGYQSGVYSSASAGILDLARHYHFKRYTMPDEIWMAWWNGRADTAGGPYVPPSEWKEHQRQHQYVDSSTESYGGHSIVIDRDYVDVHAEISPPDGCPAQIDFDTYPVLHESASRPEVLAVQCLLAVAGFDPGPANGVYGDRTIAAAKAFKGWAGLPTGTTVFASQAWEALLSWGTTRILRLGSAGLTVRRLQRALTARLGETVAITGSYGHATRQAVSVYQHRMHLPVNGIVGPPTWDALQNGS